jgi:hypothetical protein
VLRAEKVSVWRSNYRIVADGVPIATWNMSVWKHGGELVLAGRRYQIRGNAWGGRYGMAAEDGTVVAVADRVGRSQWTVQAGGTRYRFRRSSFWRQEQQLVIGATPIGSIRRVNRWRGGAVADLPGLPLPVQVFALLVVLTMWERQADAAAGGTAGIVATTS